MKYYLGLCAIAKNETKYLEEWVRYHLGIGVDHIILFDNDSDIPVSETLKDWISAGAITVIEAPGACKQLPCYETALSKFGAQFCWLGFIDLDEFIVTKNQMSLPEFLLAYEPYGGLGVNWVCFGSSGYIESPDDYVIRAYKLRLPDEHNKNLHIKSIIQPSKVKSIASNPHSFLFKEGFFAVNELKHPIPAGSAFSYFTNELIQINHYVTRSREDYIAKIKRGKADRESEPPSVINEPFKGEVSDNSIKKQLFHLLRTKDLSPREFLENSIFHQNTFLSESDLITQLARLVAQQKITDAIPLILRLSLTVSEEKSLPVKLKILNIQKRFGAVIELSEHFFKTHYSREIVKEYRFAVKNIGDGNNDIKIENIERLINFLYGYHGDVPNSEAFR
ncbi:glycosyltransferase family 2 protein [Maridesulfovibrio sp.]|uniref:glycosyltransferase family 2 protein n=1 Tax=Maridesulfovibrio sp. TaxID=2795000 RepID=UPI0029C9C0C5|nr:glycosyltransferase family 2 protein [Maridesulfovibrio sp.]